MDEQSNGQQGEELKILKKHVQWAFWKQKANGEKWTENKEHGEKKYPNWDKIKQLPFNMAKLLLQVKHFKKLSEVHDGNIS